MSQSKTTTSSWHLPLFLSVILPIVTSFILFRLDPFQPAHFPADTLSRRTLRAPACNGLMRKASETVAEGHVEGPEDLVYDAATGVLYAGCKDGCLKRVTLKESVADTTVESLVHAGGRPLGLALDRNGELIVANSDKPHGRLISYDPSTNHTSLLVSNLYLANGVAISPDQQFVIFCETVLRRCRKYYIKGPKKGSIEKFVENVPGYPDNIHYDGEGLYWIGLSSSPTYSWELALRYPIIRKALAMIVKYVGKPQLEKNGGLIAVDLEGKPIAHYYDAHFSFITSGIRIGNHLYWGSLHYPFILRLDLSNVPALPTTKHV